MSIDTWGHAGYILIFAGMFLLGRKARLGWGVRFLGDGVWCGVGMAMGMSSIWLWGLMFMVNDVLSYRRWSKKAPHEERTIYTLILHENDTLQEISDAITKDERLDDSEKADLLRQVIEHTHGPHLEKANG